MGDETTASGGTDPSIAIAGTTVLRLTLEGVQMKNMDWFSESDVFWQVETPLSGPGGRVIWQSIHRSETIMDDNSPRWRPAEIRLVGAQKQFDLYQPLRLSFYDWEANRKHKPMGVIVTTVCNLQTAKQPPKEGHWDLGKALVTKSDTGEEFGTVVVVDIGVELKNDGVPANKRLEEDFILALTLEGVDMAIMNGMFGLTDPYYVVETPMATPDGNGIVWKEFYRSEYILDSVNPRWKPALLDLDPLCNGNIDAPIRLSFFDWEKTGDHQPMGHCITSVRLLLRSVASKEGDSWDLTRAICPRDDGVQEYGRVVVVDVSLIPK